MTFHITVVETYYLLVHVAQANPNVGNSTNGFSNDAVPLAASESLLTIMQDMVSASCRKTAGSNPAMNTSCFSLLLRAESSHISVRLTGIIQNYKMAENLKKQPRKGILKNSSSFEGTERRDNKPAGTKFDEMNILATLHPADKDYGHMKIEEPKTPFNFKHNDSSGSGDELDNMDPGMLAQRIEDGCGERPRSMITPPPIEEDSEEDLSPEEQEIRKHFEMKRKKHYNEFQAVKLARKLMQQDTDEEDEDEKSKDGESSESMDAETLPSETLSPEAADDDTASAAAAKDRRE
ncbi:Protein phosphatase inhibitor 2 (IPP-2) [Trinorchestia longiramus]|nr:Protein phosphatase inhibitor 2 (IPP-2) [Trinorchestia longiramus]